MPAAFDFTTFRKNLKSLIDRRGCSARDLALRIDTSPSTITRYLSGARDPEIASAISLANFFRVPVDWLLGISDEVGPKSSEEISEIARLYMLASPDDRSVVQAVLNKYKDQAK